MRELLVLVNNQLEKLATSKNINWVDSEEGQEFLRITNIDFPKHQKWIEEGILALEKGKQEDVDLAFSKILVGIRNIYLDVELLDEQLIKFSQKYSEK